MRLESSFVDQSGAMEQIYSQIDGNKVMDELATHMVARDVTVSVAEV